VPVLQHPLGPHSPDLSYPAVLLAVEHNGRDHPTAARALRDLEREAHLTRQGWRIGDRSCGHTGAVRGAVK
jgi:very-short-patch-repair endonuclease